MSAHSPHPTIFYYMQGAKRYITAPPCGTCQCQAPTSRLPDLPPRPPFDLHRSICPIACLRYCIHSFIRICQLILHPAFHEYPPDHPAPPRAPPLPLLHPATQPAPEPHECTVLRALAAAKRRRRRRRRRPAGRTCTPSRRMTWPGPPCWPSCAAPRTGWAHRRPGPGREGARDAGRRTHACAHARTPRAHRSLAG